MKGVHVLADLAPRERQVLELIADGFCTKQIASRLKVGVKTIEYYRSRLMSKTGINHIAGLTRLAMWLGLIPTLSDPRREPSQQELVKLRKRCYKCGSGH